MIHSYATLAQVKSDVITGQTADDELYLQALYWATARIDELVEYPFVPMSETRWFDATRDNISRDGELSLYYPLLSITSVKDLNGATALTAWDGTSSGLATATYIPEPYGTSPYWSIQRMASGVSAVWSQTYSRKAIAVEGVWGYHSDYANAWLTAVDTVADAGGLDASVTTVTVTDANANNAIGLATRLSEGALIRINSEWMQVVDVSSNALTVIRGVRGTTASTHDNGDNVDVFQVDPNINRACVRIVTYLEERRGRRDEVSLDNFGIRVQLPNDLAREVTNILSMFPRRRSFWVV